MARGLGGDDVYAQAVLEYLLDPGGHRCHKPHATAQALKSLVHLMNAVPSIVVKKIRDHAC